MEDLTGKISDILSDPKMMNTIKGFTGLLDSSENKTSDKDNSESSNENPDDDFSGFSLSPELIQMILKIMPILSSIKKEDKYTRFLDALCPLLSEAKQEKLKGASKILQIIRLLPLLKETGLLWGEKV